MSVSSLLTMSIFPFAHCPVQIVFDQGKCKENNFIEFDLLVDGIQPRLSLNITMVCKELPYLHDIFCGQLISRDLYIIF